MLHTYSLHQLTRYTKPLSNTTAAHETGNSSFWSQIKASGLLHVKDCEECNIGPGKCMRYSVLN